MKLIKPSYEITTPINGEEILKQIELAARTCYKSEGKIEYKTTYGTYINIDTNEEYEQKHLVNATSARILIPKLILRGHEAMLEFSGMIIVKFICDRGISHELVRHRLSSFAQESTRYCNYGKDEHISFIIPCWTDFEEGIYDYKARTFINDGMIHFHKGNEIQATTDHLTWLDVVAIAELTYNKLIKKGWNPQQARSVLPNSLKTEINVGANIREWRHIFKLRTAKAAHPQMRELMCPLLDEFKLKIPILFDDINYEL